MTASRYAQSEKWRVKSEELWSTRSLVIMVIFVSGMRFQCHYINIIKIIFYIVSRKESAKSFLTLMTNDLNDRVSLCSKWKVKSEKWRVVVIWSLVIMVIFVFNFNPHKLYTINLHHKCRETDDGPSGKVLQNQAKCHTFAADLSDTSFQSSLITEGGLNLWLAPVIRDGKN